MATSARSVLSVVAVCLLTGGAIADEPSYIGVKVKKGETGIEVVEIVEGSPADKAGIKPNDVIRKIDGKDADNLQGFVTTIRDTKVGAKLTLVVHRDGKDMEIKVTAEKSPNS